MSKYMNDVIHKTVQVSVTLSQSWSNALAVSLPVSNEQITTNLYLQGLLFCFSMSLGKQPNFPMQLLKVWKREKRFRIIVNCPAFNMNFLLQLPINKKAINTTNKSVFRHQVKETNSLNIMSFC